MKLAKDALLRVGDDSTSIEMTYNGRSYDGGPERMPEADGKIGRGWCIAEQGVTKTALCCLASVADNVSKRSERGSEGSTSSNDSKCSVEQRYLSSNKKRAKLIDISDKGRVIIVDKENKHELTSLEKLLDDLEEHIKVAHFTGKGDQDQVIAHFRSFAWMMKAAVDHSAFMSMHTEHFLQPDPAMLKDKKERSTNSLTARKRTAVQPLQVEMVRPAPSLPVGVKI